MGPPCLGGSAARATLLSHAPCQRPVRWAEHRKSLFSQLLGYTAIGSPEEPCTAPGAACCSCRERIIASKLFVQRILH